RASRCEWVVLRIEKSRVRRFEVLPQVLFAIEQPFGEVGPISKSFCKRRTVAIGELPGVGGFREIKSGLGIGGTESAGNDVGILQAGTERTVESGDRIAVDVDVLSKERGRSVRVLCPRAAFFDELDGR